MRAFSFKARNIGDEKYLTYTMEDDCELDDEVLDFVEEQPEQLVEVIYEEDDDYDYLTYDITGKTSLADLTAKSAKSELILNVIKNIASEMIDLKEQAIPLTYLLLNRNFIYVDTETCKVKFICLPVESNAGVATEFKGFIRQLLANMKYDVEENLNFVGQLLTYINGDTFTLRGLAGLAEVLMDENGISYEATADIDADGVEIVGTETAAPAKESSVSNFMSDSEETPLPEIGDDDDESDAPEAIEDDGELESILPAGMKPVAEEPAEEATEAPAAEQPVAEAAPAATAAKEEAAPAPEGLKEPVKPVSPFAGANVVKETNVDLVKERVRKIMGEGKTSQPSAITPDVTTPMTSIKKKNVIKVNRAAIIQNVAAEQEEELAAQEAEAVAAQEAEAIAAQEAAAPTNPGTEIVLASDEELTSNSVLSKTISEPPKPNALNAPKAVPYLIRVNTNERIMLNKPTFKIGKASRGVDYTVDGNGAISRVHAIITQRDDVCYIKDNKSTNHTYINNIPIEEGAEEILTHESLVRLGDEEFTFKIR